MQIIFAVHPHHMECVAGIPLLLHLLEPCDVDQLDCGQQKGPWLRRPQHGQLPQGYQTSEPIIF